MKKPFLRARKNEKKPRSVLKVVVVLLIAFAIYGTVTAISVYNSTLTRNYENIDGLVDNTIENISQNLAMIKGTMIALSGSDAIVNWRDDNTYFSTNDKSAYLHIEELSTQMQHVLIYNNGWNLDLFDYVVVYEDDRLLAYTYTKPFNIQTIIRRSQEVYETIRNKSDYSQTIVPSSDDETIYTTLRVQGDFSGDNSIYIIGATQVSTFEKNLKKNSGFEGAVMYLADNSGTIYASNEDEKLGQKLDEKFMDLPVGEKGRDFTVDGVNYAIAKRMVNNQFSFIYMLPKSVIIRETLQSLQSLLLLSIITMVIMVILVTMIESQYQAKILAEESELNFLQQQMNPHFLFNILLTIQIKAKMSGDEGVSRMITSLSNLLRAGIYKDKRSIITIGEELKYAEYYLSLQKERFEDRLIYSIDVEDSELYECEVPRLSIEPLVENAVVHGVETLSQQGVIGVTVSTDGDDVVVHVRDNGVGFDPDSLKLDGVKISNDGTLPRESVGMINTDHRMKIIYGREYGISVDSRPGEGTDITVRFPRRRLKVTND